MQTAIAIFCKTPELSPVKTRLGADIGRSYAEEFYKLSLSVVKEVVLQVIKKYDHKVDAYWATAEKEAGSNPIWKSFQCIWTGEGGLGERINHIYEQLLPSYEQVIIIGSDSPQITSDYLVKAIEMLSQRKMDAVIGPCKDGGFVLFGSRKSIPKSIWTEVKYSREDTLEQLISLMKKKSFHYSAVSELGDVDNYNDLIMLVNDYIHMGPDLLPQQQKMFQWLHDILITRRLYQKTQISHTAGKN